jgi:hypothetical protein
MTQCSGDRPELQNVRLHIVHKVCSIVTCKEPTLSLYWTGHFNCQFYWTFHVTGRVKALSFMEEGHVLARSLSLSLSMELSTIREATRC